MPLLPARRRSTLDLLSTEGADHDRAGSDLSGSRSLGSPRLADDADDDVSSGPHRPVSPAVQEANPATKRFSLLRFRHFSESQLSTRARLQAEQLERPPMPSMPASQYAPAIITTAPTLDLEEERRNKKERRIPFKRQLSKTNASKSALDANDRNTESRSILPWRRSQDQRREQKRLSTVSTDNLQVMPAPSASSPNLSLSGRKSAEKSRSPKGSPRPSPRGSPSRDNEEHGSMRFRLPGRNKRKSLFPVPIKLEPPQQMAPQYPDTAPATPRASTSALSMRSLNVSPAATDTTAAALMRRYTEDPRWPDDNALAEAATHTSLPKSAISFAPRGYPLIRNDSNQSNPSTRSSPNAHRPRRLTLRDRASTMSTFGRPSVDMGPPTPPTLAGSARNSTSTSGRASLGNFLTLSRFRHGSDDNGFRHDSPGGKSKSNSFAMSRETLTLPEREDGESAAKYLERLQDTVSRSVIAGMLATVSDTFFAAVLRSYTRRFAFFGEPIDMSLRKFLLEADLPKETQQVDRVIQAFADRYHECNPGTFPASDKAYIVAFSLMMLHTDAFNKNNKRKMQKADYIKNTRGQDVSEDVLACFYDNICYTPFIHFDEDDFDASSERLAAAKSKKTKLKGAAQDPSKKPNGPVDPYSLIIDSRLDVLRPSLKDSVTIEDPYTYLGTLKQLDLVKIQRSILNTGILQIISARSRPAAFESEAGRDNPQEAKPGVVDLQVTKIGLLWRKAPKKKKGRSPWQEWGAILTGSQLYLFKNVAWIKVLMNQYISHQRTAVPPSAVRFHPPLEVFKPDAQIKTDDAVALMDRSYTRHKNAFLLTRHGGEEEIFLADNESDLNDWLSLINYAAAFRHAAVQIRGVALREGSSLRPPGPPRFNSANTVRSVKSQVKTNAPHARLEAQHTCQVMAARRKQMINKIAEAEMKLENYGQLLDSMVRDARHLLVLAPIQPRTREMVIYAAATLDARLKWLRRDIWRTKCYKEILSKDALEDSDDVIKASSKLRPMSMMPLPNVEAQQLSPQSLAFSPPQTPMSPLIQRSRSMSSEIVQADNDIFQTPPESARKAQIPKDWQLPSLELSPADPQRRPSVVSTSASSARRPSTTQLSSSSSLHDLDRLTVTNSDAIRSSPRTPNGPLRGGDALGPSLSGTSASTTAGRRLSDAGVLASTPDTMKSRSNRRSLHRTLRDGLHGDGGGSLHRHRKGKDSASTVKSDVNTTEEPADDGTPGLERGKGRFIVHGKQASVITFGGDWTGEKMRNKREEVEKGKLDPMKRLSDHTADGGAEDEDASVPVSGYFDNSKLPTEHANSDSLQESEPVQQEFADVEANIIPDEETANLASDAMVAEAYTTRTHEASSAVAPSASLVHSTRDVKQSRLSADTGDFHDACTSPLMDSMVAEHLLETTNVKAAGGHENDERPATARHSGEAETRDHQIDDKRLWRSYGPETTV